MNRPTAAGAGPARGTSPTGKGQTADRQDSHRRWPTGPARLSTRAAAHADLMDPTELAPAELALTPANRRRLVRHLLALETRRFDGAVLRDPESSAATSPDPANRCQPSPPDRETS